jgi:two-component system sensor kinase FixL
MHLPWSADRSIYKGSGGRYISKVGAIRKHFGDLQSGLNLRLRGLLGYFKHIKMNYFHNQSNELAILKGAVENTNEAFVTIDQNHKVIFFNKAAENIFGYGRDEVIGHDLDVIMSHSCSRDHRQAVERYAKTRVPSRIGHETEVLATRKHGKTFPASISFSVSDIDGSLYFTGIVRDLTETKALKEKVTRSERLAALGQVVAEITHEIKNPLMMIGGFANQLIRETEDEKSLTKLNIIADEVSRLESLLKELRDFYLPRVQNIEEIDINSLLQEVYSLVKVDCEGKKINAEIKTDKKSVIVEADRAKLEQVFLNLLKNSMEAMENGGNLSVQPKLIGDMVEITIADDGIGIPEADQEKIFSPFFTTKKHGTGLGLSISRSIIEENEGSSLTLKSEEGKGTVFTITMPVCKAAMRESIKTAEARSSK